MREAGTGGEQARELSATGERMQSQEQEGGKGSRDPGRQQSQTHLNLPQREQEPETEGGERGKVRNTAM